MKLETFFRIITVFGFIAIVIFVANAASAKPSRPQISSKVYKLEKKNRKPIKVDNKIKSAGREFDMNGLKDYDKFWAASLEEQKKYPLTLRRKFVHTRRARRMRAEEEKLRAKNPKEFVKQKRVNPTKVPYTKEEIEILGTDDRRLTAGEKLSIAINGKVSKQSKIGNKVINLEVK